MSFLTVGGKGVESLYFYSRHRDKQINLNDFVDQLISDNIILQEKLLNHRRRIEILESRLEKFSLFDPDHLAKPEEKPKSDQ